MSATYVEVALPPPLARQLTYRLPADMEDPPGVGALVLVPVSRRRLSGVVVGLADGPPDGVREEQMRDVDRVLDPQAVSADMLRLCQWMSEYYFAPLGSALAAALPPGVQRTSSRIVRLADLPLQSRPGGETEMRILAELQAAGPLPASLLRRRIPAADLEPALRRLREAGHVEVDNAVRAGGTRTRRALHLRVADAQAARAQLPALEARAPRQAACLRYLLEAGVPVPRAALAKQGYGVGLLAALEKGSLVERVAAEVVRDPLAHIAAGGAEALVPTPEQQQVLAALEAALTRRCFQPVLLHGVTGSGKTLVYLSLVERALASGRGAIVLVPEIALAWQMVRRFRARLGEQAAVVHSELSSGERYDTWRRLRRGEQRVVIGARSAVLAPVAQLGVLVVDEEHDGAYKQEDVAAAFPLPYSARDVALVRGQQARAVVVLGSATPSLESYWNAQSGKYALLALPRRVDDRPLPRVQVVDLRREPCQRRKRTVISETLRQEMRRRLERGEKIVLLQNRRGFAPHIVCPACGEAVHCRSCRVSLTYHRGPEPHVRCHYCDFRSPPPSVCPSCSAAELRFEGVGTQKVEDVLLAQFPGIRVIRMDVDTTGWKGAHDVLVERFRRGEADVLLGTQMVAKGLDFPEVTLVGVISADTGMHLPDFRAAERTFQLLTQVAGRSGRGSSPGEVVIQTLLPEDLVLQDASRQDFRAFADRELGERQQAGFPPYARLILLRWQGMGEGEVEAAARQGAAVLGPLLHGGLSVLGPAPAPLARLRGQYRWQLLLRGAAVHKLREAAARALPELRATCPRSVTLTVNVDPQTIM
ncbi:MAG: primosomal protein N' [Candidatus Latescibacterota bacterium]